MFGKKFFSTVALSGVAVSLVGNVGSFAEEKFPDDGILFKCTNSGVTFMNDDDFDDSEIDLQYLVSHFRLTREETEKLLKYMRSLLEKSEKLDSFSVDCGHPDNFSEIGQIGLRVFKNAEWCRRKWDFAFFVVKKHDNWCHGYLNELCFPKSKLDAMLACNLDDIDFSAAKPLFGKLGGVFFLALVFSLYIATKVESKLAREEGKNPESFSNSALYNSY